MEFKTIKAIFLNFFSALKERIATPKFNVIVYMMSSKNVFILV